MKTGRRAFTIGLTAWATGLAVPAIAETIPTGNFIGTVEAGTVRYRFRLLIDRNGKAMLYDVDRNNAEIPLGETKIAKDATYIAIPSFGAVYEGKFRDADHLDGTVALLGQSFSLNFVRGEGFSADPIDSGPLDQAKFDAYRIRLGTPGMAAAWAAGKAKPKLLLSGVRSAGAVTQLAPNDKWHLGSIGKSMTAAMIAQLVEAGKLHWESTVGDVLGKAIPNMLSAYRDATLLHLLSHRSGMPRQEPEASTADFTTKILPDARAERLRYCKLALSMTPEAKLGEREIYSNMGYTVAGAMAEAATGKSWETLMREFVFKPLKLKSAGFGPPPAGNPTGHDVAADGTRKPNRTDLITATAPAGLVHMSAEDVLIYLAAHRDKPKKFLSCASWTKLHSPPFGGNYALGWTILEDGTLWHSGSNQLWFAEVAIKPKTGAIAVFTANDFASFSWGPGKVIGAELRSIAN